MSEDQGRVIDDGKDLVREAEEARKALDVRFRALDVVMRAMDDNMSIIFKRQDTIEKTIKALDGRVLALEGADAANIVAFRDIAEKLKPLDAPKQPAPDKLKERFLLLKNEIVITQAAIDMLQTRLSMPNNFKLTSRDVSELSEMVKAGIAHITVCEKEMGIAKEALANRYVEQWREKQKNKGK